MDVTFKILAVILAGIAAYFLWQGNADRAFAAAVFGAISFFLSVRFQVKARLKEREAEDERRRAEEEEAGEEEEEYDEEEFENFDPPRLNDQTAAGRLIDDRRTTDQEKSRTTDKEKI